MSRSEKLYVLYGSQMGNSEGAAKDFCNLIKSNYNDEYFNQHKLPSLEAETTCMQLDDFLEIEHSNYTKCLVIFVSSYGVGQGKNKHWVVAPAAKQTDAANFVTFLSAFSS